MPMTVWTGRLRPARWGILTSSVTIMFGSGVGISDVGSAGVLTSGIGNSAAGICDYATEVRGGSVCVPFSDVSTFVVVDSPCRRQHRCEKISAAP